VTNGSNAGIPTIINIVRVHWAQETGTGGSTHAQGITGRSAIKDWHRAQRKIECGRLHGSPGEAGVQRNHRDCQAVPTISSRNLGRP
jgi:hypothetical protein